MGSIPFTEYDYPDNDRLQKRGDNNRGTVGYITDDNAHESFMATRRRLNNTGFQQVPPTVTSLNKFITIFH